MFDTHCHLNFSRFKKNVDEVISRAKEAGVVQFVVPGTDPDSSRKAVELSEKYEGVYAAVGIHPHHAFEYILRHPERAESFEAQSKNLIYAQILRSAQDDLQKIENLVKNPTVVAVGEIGLDKHIYKETKYEAYNVSEEFLRTQQELLTEQFKLAVNYNKSVILHNREAVDDLLELLEKNWNKHFESRMVFHCCEPNNRLLTFAKKHNIFIGVDGDITYDKAKQDFIKKVPLEMLVVETDSPFLLPEPLRSRKEFPNEPKNIPLIISCTAALLGKSEEEIIKTTTENGKRLFSI